MNLFYSALFLLTMVKTQITSAQNTKEVEITTTLPDVSTDQPSSESSPILLDSQLRSALLRALSEIEEDEDKFEENDEEVESDVKKAQASAITIFQNSHVESNEEGPAPIQDTTFPASESEEDTSTEQANFVLFQKSEALQSQTINSLDDKPLDPIKDAEQIITSASSNILPQNAVIAPQTKGVDSRENVLQNEQMKFQSPKAGFANLNTINNNEGRKTSKPVLVEKFSIGKAVEEPFVVKSYAKPSSGPKEENSGVAYVKPIQKFIQTNYKNGEIRNNSFSGVNDAKKGNESRHNAEVTEVSTEENEAKVEQVQFFTAPLVAAFTVHQDEKGLPNKVEPIYKNSASQLQQTASSSQQSTATQANQNILQSSTFNNLDLARKQQVLEQELEKLRIQQQSLAARNINQPIHTYNQHNFNQAINKNFNQFDPVFTEPDRSVVTKLAVLDPSSLVLNRFTANEAISTGNLKPSGDVSVLPSISFDPLVEAGKLPKNAQILPNKEPTGFLKIPDLPKVQKQQANKLFEGARLQLPVVQPHVNFLQQNRFSNPQQTLQTFNNQNRFLRQESLGIANPGFNSFSIVAAQQPFAPRHELSYFPSDNRFLMQQNHQNIRGVRHNLESTYQGLQLQDPNRFLRSNLEGTLIAPQTINIQSQLPNQNRFFRSNLEGNLGFNQPQNNNRFLRSNQETSFSTNQHVPVLHNYRYSSSFGQPIIPLN